MLINPLSSSEVLLEQNIYTTDGFDLPSEKAASVPLTFSLLSYPNLKLCVDTATHNFKWLKTTDILFNLSPKYVDVKNNILLSTTV